MARDISSSVCEDSTKACRRGFPGSSCDERVAALIRSRPTEKARPVGVFARRWQKRSCPSRPGAADAAIKRTTALQAQRDVTEDEA